MLAARADNPQAEIHDVQARTLGAVRAATVTHLNRATFYPSGSKIWEIDVARLRLVEFVTV